MEKTWEFCGKTIYKDGREEGRFLVREDFFLYLVGIFWDRELGKGRRGMEFKFEVFFAR